MVRASNPPIPYGNEANGDTEQESSENHEVVQPFRTTTEERTDPDTLLTSRASARDLKEGDEPTSVRQAFKEELEKSGGTSLSQSRDAALHPKTSYNHDSGPSRTYDYRTNIERTFLARNVTYDPSNESLDGISTPSQMPTPLVTFGVHNDGFPPIFSMSADLFSSEKLAMGSHRQLSTSTENKSMLNTLTIKMEPTSLRPGPYKHDATICQAELAQMSAAAKNASSQNCEILAQKLGAGAAYQSQVGNTPVQFYDPCLDAGIYAEKLKLLACLIHCKNNHQGQAIDMAEAWKRSLSVSSQSINDLNLPDRIVRSHTPTHEVKHIRRAVSVLELSMKRPVDIEFSHKGNLGTEIIIRKFVPYDPKIKNMFDTANLVKGVIWKDLSHRDIAKDGFIYIYWFPVNFGHIKIGVTTRSADVRLREWENQCGHKPELMYPKSIEDMQRVPHVWRVEAIVHAELRKFRRKEVECNACHKAHNEWFESSTSAAIIAVKKWSAWMQKEPYEPSGRLKDEQKQDLQNLSNIVPDGEARSLSPRPRQWIRQPRSGRIDSRFRSHSEQPRRRSSRLRMRREEGLSGK